MQEVFKKTGSKNKLLRKERRQIHEGIERVYIEPFVMQQSEYIEALTRFIVIRVRGLG